ncbi:hypothetical protein M409DRAFT_27956 [Zasmidium cellare ATCC 36951]|uniref:Uncharacterized protein n=1 Tax=Zasmidium cellare ATCC 36951 TaxID=1080233 RepID=A0A6A6C5T4_ZASCE|nr:uncharacterized protein M409DRAFT_27956 [Zasmidium cellare ATCC 36951]KAF2161560.1 hypothetical protein M409DRAFT_27956 [Zasmidium cellare ATCC 36951]
MCSDLFATETRAYVVLQSLQGKQIPKLYSTVTLPLDTGSQVVSSKAGAENFLTISGILIEYISGPTSSDMAEVIPRESWQVLIDQAVQIVRSYSRLGILNKDSEADWGRAKSGEDEEGAIGAVMTTRLAKLDFQLEYTPSYEWIQYAARE